ncbi:MAG: hypothetical protein MRT15_12125 [archaeon YNP-LCB-003-016]|uniref:hypothetical protein n=1 Tax=Candidatus Culexarchaeum yellowstonense TaxID=2928963 RepID=UPI0026F0C0E0|nr:hypothetical protein [Candidatus Culexarchaeum yellowstonense]MCR6693133.1 hypothetical protein [Candidatus Culexarchaeum yellowstonense]
MKVKVELTGYITLEQYNSSIGRRERFEPITVKLSEVEVEVPDELVNVLKVIPNSSLRVRVEGERILEVERQ